MAPRPQQWFRQRSRGVQIVLALAIIVAVILLAFYLGFLGSRDAGDVIPIPTSRSR
ncbi:hypothetical protein BO068_004819 [Escherichia coli]|nr:hypothetical protein [Escherichia coli]